MRLLLLDVALVSLCSLPIFGSLPLLPVAQPRPPRCRYQSPQLPRGDRGLSGIAQGAPPPSPRDPSPPPGAPLPSEHLVSWSLPPRCLATLLPPFPVCQP